VLRRPLKAKTIMPEPRPEPEFDRLVHEPRRLAIPTAISSVSDAQNPLRLNILRRL
jgi:hypothetical protein